MGSTFGKTMVVMGISKTKKDNIKQNNSRTKVDNNKGKMQAKAQMFRKCFDKFHKFVVYCT